MAQQAASDPNPFLIDPNDELPVGLGLVVSHQSQGTFVAEGVEPG